MRIRSSLLVGVFFPLLMTGTSYPRDAQSPAAPLVLAANQACAPGTVCPKPDKAAPADGQAKPARDRNRAKNAGQQQEQPAKAAPAKAAPAKAAPAKAAAEPKPPKRRQGKPAVEKPAAEPKAAPAGESGGQNATPAKPRNRQAKPAGQPAKQAAPAESGDENATPAKPRNRQQGKPAGQTGKPAGEAAAPKPDGGGQAGQGENKQGAPGRARQDGKNTTTENPADTAAEPAKGNPPGKRDSTGESTVEQQLNAQGDQEEATKVRRLRDKLRQENEAEGTGQRQGDEAERPRQGDNNNNQADNENGRPRDSDRQRDRGKVVERRGDRIIIDLGGGRIRVEHSNPDEDNERLLYRARDVEVQHLRNGLVRTVVYRDDGSQIFTTRNRYGEVVQRVRRTPNGRDIVLFDSRFEDSGPPRVVYVPGRLPPPVIGIPENQYIVDLGQASEQDIETALLAPPVQPIEQQYTLDEVTQNQELRAYVPRIDLDTITFEFGSSTIGNDQMQSLSALGQAMEQVITDHPDEVYLVEGHTDAVGSDNDNLILSDERAESVAVALSQNFNIPPENLVTEGYGEQYLKVNTEAPEQQNRRVTVRRITPLLQAQGQQ